ncbi:MAG: ATP-binding protein [Promethearchaeota archaeon]
MIYSEEHKRDLLKIAKKLQKKSQSCPTNEKGEPSESYLEYISLMYEPEVAKVAHFLEIFPKTTSLNKLSKITGLSKEELEKLFEPVVKRGFIMKLGKRYSLANPLLIYDAPFILKENYESKEIKDFAKLSREFFENGYYKKWETNRHGIPRSRVLTVSEVIEPTSEIIPIEDVYKIIENNDTFALVRCPCRWRKEIEGIRKCKGKYPIHNCIILGRMAEGLIELGDEGVKKVSKEEVMKITKEAAEIGLVHTTDNNANMATILCACCECCCGLIGGLTRFDNPRAIARANYISTIDKDACIACETCIDRCKFGAIHVEDYAIVDEKRCVGCGLCAVTCPEEAIIMKRYEREKIPSY